MNHRELILTTRKKAKFGFLALPELLQDDVIARLDGQDLTLEGARDYLKDHGYTLSHEAIAGYYRAVRRERRIHDASQEMVRMFEAFGDQPLEDNVRTLTNFLIATAVRKLADGEVGIKDVDLARVIQAMAGVEARGERREAQGRQADAEIGRQGDGETGRRGDGETGRRMTPETIQKVREEIYGLL